MSAKIWFILNEGQVTGPFEPSDIETRLSQGKDAQIWGRGLPEWMSPAKWRQNLHQHAAPIAAAAESPVQWKVRIEGKEKAPMSYAALIKLLKETRDYSVIDVCPEDSTTWKEIFAVPRIVNELGISRRSHPRVPILGTFQCTNDNNDSFTFRVITISEGGLGVNDAHKVQIGTRFKGSLKSPNLYVEIEATCEVVYAGKDGYAGLKFVGLPAEFTTSIIEYVNKFATT